MTFKIVPREEIGLPEKVTSTDGSHRPLVKNCKYLTIHYTGVFDNQKDYSDVGDTPEEILWLEQIARQAGKPNEYNYVIGSDDDDFIYEYAGTRRAAHSSGENSIAIGVLLFLNVEDAPTTKMIQKIQWLRDVLKYYGVLSKDAETTPHKNMPGAATACPGQHVLNNWGAIIAPYQQETQQETPEPPVGTGLVYKIESGDNYWSIARKLYSTSVGAAVRALMDANDSKDLYAGKFLKVPGKVVL